MLDVNIVSAKFGGITHVFDPTALVLLEFRDKADFLGFYEASFDQNESEMGQAPVMCIRSGSWRWQPGSSCESHESEKTSQLPQIGGFECRTRFFSVKPKDLDRVLADLCLIRGPRDERWKTETPGWMRTIVDVNTEAYSARLCYYPTTPCAPEPAEIRDHLYACAQTLSVDKEVRSASHLRVSFAPSALERMRLLRQRPGQRPEGL